MKRLLLIVFIILGSAALFYILTFERTGNKVSSTTVVESFMENIKVVNRIGGKEQWSLSAEKASIAGEEADIKVVMLTLPGEEMTVSSDAGSYGMDTGNLTLTGNVHAETKNYSIKTGTLDILDKDDVIKTDEPVLIESRSFRIEGSGLSVQGDTVRILNNVSAEFY